MSTSGDVPTADALEQQAPVDDPALVAPEDEALDDGEATDADRAEQLAEVAPEPHREPVDVPLETDPADALDQATVVPQPDDERPEG